MSRVFSPARHLRRDGFVPRVTPARSNLGQRVRPQRPARIAIHARSKGQLRRTRSDAHAKDPSAEATYKAGEALAGLIKTYDKR